MKVLIYKRTHKGDPDSSGIFGNEDCMGKIRNWSFDAVIGIGGKSAWKGHEGIRERINWIGVAPKRIPATGNRGDCVVFKHFALYEDSGCSIKEDYPNLYEFMYGNGKRFDMCSELDESVYFEVQKIIESVSNFPESNAYNTEFFDKSNTQFNFVKSSCGGCFSGKNVEIHINEC